jgi:hypothetical protein
VPRFIRASGYAPADRRTCRWCCYAPLSVA